jgi:hypothetical protein
VPRQPSGQLIAPVHHHRDLAVHFVQLRVEIRQLPAQATTLSLTGRRRRCARSPHLRLDLLKLGARSRQLRCGGLVVPARLVWQRGRGRLRWR